MFTCFRYSEKFSKFAHDVLYRATHPVRIPIGGAVFDYCLEESSGTFIKWSEKQQERLKVLAGGYAITPEVICMLWKKNNGYN